MKQISTGRYLGVLKLVGQNIMPYLNIFTMVFAGIAAYIPISSWFLSQGIQFPFWAFMLIVAIGIFLLTILEYFIMFPSYFSSWNQQMWDHDSPIRTELAEIKQKLIELENKSR